MSAQEMAQRVITDIRINDHKMMTKILRNMENLNTTVHDYQTLLGLPQEFADSINSIDIFSAGANALTTDLRNVMEDIQKIQTTLYTFTDVYHTMPSVVDFVDRAQSIQNYIVNGTIDGTLFVDFVRECDEMLNQYTYDYNHGSYYDSSFSTSSYYSSGYSGVMYSYSPAPYSSSYTSGSNYYNTYSTWNDSSSYTYGDYSTGQYNDSNRQATYQCFSTITDFLFSGDLLLSGNFFENEGWRMINYENAMTALYGSSYPQEYYTCMEKLQLLYQQIGPSLDHLGELLDNLIYGNNGDMLANTEAIIALVTSDEFVLWNITTNGSGYSYNSHPVYSPYSSYSYSPPPFPPLFPSYPYDYQPYYPYDEFADDDECTIYTCYGSVDIKWGMGNCELQVDVRDIDNKLSEYYSSIMYEPLPDTSNSFSTLRNTFMDLHDHFVIKTLSIVSNMDAYESGNITKLDLAAEMNSVLVTKAISDLVDFGSDLSTSVKQFEQHVNEVKLIVTQFFKFVVYIYTTFPGVDQYDLDSLQMIQSLNHEWYDEQPYSSYFNSIDEVLKLEAFNEVVNAVFDNILGYMDTLEKETSDGIEGLSKGITDFQTSLARYQEDTVLSSKFYM